VRIIAGEFRGRKLKTLPGRDVRPTSDRLREALFNVLLQEVPGAVFIDCYAGSGAVGLEALSRGAAQVFLVESDAGAARVIEQNLAAIQPAMPPGATVQLLRADVRAGLRKIATLGVRADICFLDPPYAELPAALKTVEWLCGSFLTDPEGVVILEHSRRDSTPEVIGEWRRARLLQQGSSALSFYRRR
jgi:16S rRNA (guanine(966)-N(2))-methyltransferase RsmD